MATHTDYVYDYERSPAESRIVKQLLASYTGWVS